jgi:hypothetical protein
MVGEGAGLGETEVCREPEKAFIDCCYKINNSFLFQMRDIFGCDVSTVKRVINAICNQIKRVISLTTRRSRGNRLTKADD